MFIPPLVLDLVHWGAYVLAGLAVIGMLFRGLSPKESDKRNEG